MLDALLNSYALLPGVAALVMVLVNVARSVRQISDSNAERLMLLLNLVLFVGYAAATQFFNYDVLGFDSVLSGFAGLIAALAGLIGQVIMSRGMNARLQGVPVIGTPVYR